MQGKFVGFEVALGKSVRPHAVAVFDLLEKVGSVDFEKGGQAVSVTMQRKGDNLFGKIIRFMGEKAFQKGRRGGAGKKPVVTMQKLPNGEELVAVSYFVLNVKSFCGLYFNYGGAYPFGGVRTWIEQTVRTVVAAFRKANPPAKGKGKDSDYTCSCDVLVRTESLPTILSHWRKLSGFQVSVATKKPAVNKYGPLSDILKREVHTFFLDVKYTDGKGWMKHAIDAIIKQIDWSKSHYGDDAKTKLIGENEHGTDLTIDLENVVDVFDVMTVEEVITDVELEKPNHYDTVVGLRLAELVEAMPEYFGTMSQ